MSFDTAGANFYNFEYILCKFAFTPTTKIDNCGIRSVTFDVFVCQQ